MIRPGRLWWLVKRDIKRGLSTTYHDYICSPKIWNHPSPLSKFPPNNLPAVHVVGGAEQFNLAGWMLSSWIQQTEQNWNIILHDDGTLSEWHFQKFHNNHPNAIIRKRSDSDQSISVALKNFPACWQARQHYAPSLKFFDALIESKNNPFIVLDTDILFYKRPTFILDWALNPSGSYFMRDLKDAYITDSSECLEIFNLPLWSNVNSGICLIEPGTIDLDFTERFLTETNLLSRRGWTHEQTLFAVNASRHNRGGHLDEGDYELSHNRHRSPSAACRHYVGHVRNLFYSEGVASLKSTLLA